MTAGNATSAVAASEQRPTTPAKCSLASIIGARWSATPATRYGAPCRIQDITPDWVNRLSEIAALIPARVDGFYEVETLMPAAGSTLQDRSPRVDRNHMIELSRPYGSIWYTIEVPTLAHEDRF